METSKIIQQLIKLDFRFADQKTLGKIVFGKVFITQWISKRYVLLPWLFIELEGQKN